MQRLPRAGPVGRILPADGAIIDSGRGPGFPPSFPLPESHCREKENQSAKIKIKKSKDKKIWSQVSAIVSPGRDQLQRCHEKENQFEKIKILSSFLQLQPSFDDVDIMHFKNLFHAASPHYEILSF